VKTGGQDQREVRKTVLRPVQALGCLINNNDDDDDDDDNNNMRLCAKASILISQPLDTK
jgi:hypothetical protein